jgi:DNA-binding transcriptional ArsR family regulator
MLKLRPTFWRTCRVIANESRLKLLWAVFEEPGLCVGDLAEKTGLRPNYTSMQLRALNSRGLITQYRVDLRVLYYPEVNDSVDYAPEFLNSLRVCYERGIPLKKVISHATAFTHQRRIEIVQAMGQLKKMKFAEIQEATGMSSPALSRHLSKLSARGVVRVRRDRYRVQVSCSPPGCFWVELLTGGSETAG